MSGHVLVDLLVVLVAAKAAAEVAERVRVPAVLGEIAAGMALGPSALGLVQGGDFLHVVGEIGVILLLLEVGMEMDLRELTRVGRASMLVAVGGMVLPFVAGWGALTAIGEGGDTAVFLGAALTATSVGITARAFGDMKALAGIEARIVIGAAVADDVLGLIVLTVVARIAGGETVSAGQVLVVIAVAMGFLVVATAIGLALAPGAIALVHRNATSAGTLVAVAFVFTLGFAELAQAADLAPIVGAFVAGLALSRSAPAERISRELAPLGHLFIPVFFFLIGTEARLSALTDGRVLGIAALLSVLAVAGKVLAGWFATGTQADRLLLGLGMVPRGEVGLIFATIGRSTGVLDDDLYAALLLVVLVTTVITPPLLRWRHGVVTARTTAPPVAGQRRPAGGWLSVEDDRLQLRGWPDPTSRLEVALDAARLASEADPGDSLLDWFDRTARVSSVWTPTDTEAFTELLASATPRSWRLLDAAGVFETAAPELADAMATRRRDIGQLDPGRLHDWPTLDRLGELLDDDGGDRTARQQFALAHDHDLLRLAAVLVDVESTAGPAAADRFLERLDVGDDRRQTIVEMLADATLLRSASSHLDGLEDSHVMPVAAHLGAVERLRNAYLLALATGEPSPRRRDRLDALRDRVETELSLHDPASDDPDDDPALVERRRRSAIEATSDARSHERVATAPASVVLFREPAELADLVTLLDRDPPASGGVVVRVGPPVGAAADSPLRRSVVVAGRDSAGFMAAAVAALASQRARVLTATAATWPDGAVLDVFEVHTEGDPPEGDRIAAAIGDRLEAPVGLRAFPALDIRFDNAASPWHTLCVVTGPDEDGVLAAVTAAMAVEAIAVHSARIDTADGRVADRFSVTDRHGAKLDAATQERLRTTLASGSSAARPGPMARALALMGRAS